jgi:thioester reductase-like protein
MAAADSIFVTGATGLVGAEVLVRMLRHPRGPRAYVLVRDASRWDALTSRLQIPAGRVLPLVGDVTLPGLGLSLADRATLARETCAVVHAAADTTFSRTLEEARRTNTLGTSHLLDLAAGWPGLERFAFVSTAFVAGWRTGVVAECDGGDDAGWINAYEQSKYEAERLVRDNVRDWLVLRPSTIVCDSPSGVVTQYNAVHRALRLYHSGLASMMPGAEETLVDVVPLDYVADAVASLALRPELAGRTLHLCAGAGALPLGELLDLTYAIWASKPGWKRRAIARPALTDLATYRLFERTVEETADARLKQVTRSLAHFIPQLAFPKRFETSGADVALGATAPPVRGYWERLIVHLLETNWGAVTRAAA